MRVFKIALVVLFGSVSVASATFAQAYLERESYGTIQAERGIVINEVYIGTTAGNFTATDQFIELYNPTTTTQYLDGNLIVRFGTGGKLVGTALTSVAEAWKFPGKPGGKSLAIPPATFVVIAASAKTYSGGLDLSTANWETYAGNAILDQDNPSVPNLVKIGSTQFALDLSLSATQDAIALTNGMDTSITDGINVSDIIDVIQYGTSTARGTLPSALDAGVAGGVSLVLGKSIERKALGVSTRNSANDFVIVAPTPGSQHVASGGSGGGTGGGGSTGGSSGFLASKAIDLFPAALHQFVDYDEHTTDTLGVPDMTSSQHGSYTVFGNHQSFGGSTSVVWVRDSSGAFGAIGGTPTELHYDAVSPSYDVKVFADSNFLNLFAPGVGNVLTPPNKFVDYIKLSAGENHSYPITTISQNIQQGGVTALVTVTVSGVWKSIERVQVPKGTYDSAYRFTNTANIVITVLGFPFSQTTVTQNLWLVKGIGIVKSNVPATKTANFSAPGVERDMTNYGIRGVTSEVVPSETAPRSNLVAFPNPSTREVTLELDRPATEIRLYSETGQFITGVAVGETTRSAALSVLQLTDGVYMARVTYADGSFGSTRVLVHHSN